MRRTASTRPIGGKGKEESGRNVTNPAGKTLTLDVKASVGRGGPIFGFNERLWDLFHLKRPSVRQACSRHPQPQIG